MITRELLRYEVTGQFRHVRVIENIITIVDGALLSHKLNHSRIISPGDDYSSESADIAVLCAALHTPEVIEAYQEMQANQEQ